MHNNIYKHGNMSFVINICIIISINMCLDNISCIDEFVIYHIPREENPRANALAQ
jgi:hypothetical protein